ncbi:MAG TPA: hypothetical protein PLD47_06935, partial [Aggregatilineales bacterium]|nr:hypothetical protein [Aggregatilineales bacterium]
NSPANGQQVARLIEITGTVQMPNMNRYQIELGQGQNPTAFSIVDGPFATSGQGFLGRWETNRVPDGVYTLRLWAVDSRGRYAARTAQVIVNNTSPIQPTPQIPPTAGFPGFSTPTPDFGIPPTATLPAITDPFAPFPTPSGSDGGLLFPPTTSP